MIHLTSRLCLPRRLGSSLSPFLRVRKNTVGESCSCPFPLSPHPFGGVFGSSGELLLLENSVAGNGGSDEHWERGGVGHGTPPCA